MADFRFDLLQGRWVLVAPAPSSDEADASERSTDCALCRPMGDPSPAWQVRVLPRPDLLGGPGSLASQWLGPALLQGPGVGVTELLVLSPDHTRSWTGLDDRHLALVMAAVADRLRGFAAIAGVRCAAATVASHDPASHIDHPHGWLAGLPVTPQSVRNEIHGFHLFSGNCLLCATGQEEECEGHRLVHADDEVVVICPFWSSSPYEMLVLPRHHPHLHAAAASDLAATGWAVRSALRALESRVRRPHYQVTFHTAPYDVTEFHWHAHVVLDRSAVTTPLDVELNTVAPEQAAIELRRAYAEAAGTNRRVASGATSR